MNRKTIQAIIRTLSASVESGLNASLTPGDCREILKLIYQAARQNPRGDQTSFVFEKMKGVVRDFAEGVLDDLLDGPPEGPPGRKRK